MENLDNIKFKMTIPYNNQILVKSRKKTKINLSIIFFLFALFCGTFLTVVLISKDAKEMLPYMVIFAISGMVCLGVAIYSLATMKARDKDKDKSIEYTFYENHFEIKQQGGKKTKYLKNCLYKKYKDKQYIKKLVERVDRLEMVILAGYLNLVPQYEKFIIPIPKKASEKVDNFKSFLKEKVTKYIVKK